MPGKFSVAAGGQGGVPPSPPFKRPAATAFDKVAALAMVCTVCAINSKLLKANMLSLQAEELKVLGVQLIKAGLALIKFVKFHPKPSSSNLVV